MIASFLEARNRFYEFHFSKELLVIMLNVKNKHVQSWIDEMAALTCPDKIVLIDGSEEQAEALRAEACSTGEMIKLNE